MACQKIGYKFSQYQDAYKGSLLWTAIRDYEFPNGHTKCSLHHLDVWGFVFVFMAIIGALGLWSNLTK